MDHLLDVEIMEKAADAETTLKQIKECIKFKDSKGLKTFILEHKIKDQTIFWEIASELTGSLTAENLENHAYFFETCQRCLNYVIENGNPKELLLALLEQADEFKDDEKFKNLLDGVQKILMKLPAKRHHSLDITLETLSAHIEAIPEPEDHNLDGEERKLLELDSSVIRVTDVVLCYLEFLKPFVWEVSTKNPEAHHQRNTPQVQLLIKYLLKLLKHPLLYLDMTFNTKEESERQKSYSRVCSERLIEHLVQLCPNFFSLIEDNTDKRRLLKTSQSKKVDVDDKSEDDVESDSKDIVRDWSEDDLISEESLACLSYMVLAENLGISNFPAVFKHKFILRFHLPVIVLLLQNKHSIVKFKGVFLLEKLMNVIEPLALKHYDLDNDAFKQILNLLIDTMTHCQNQDLRKQCVHTYSRFFEIFSLQGRHRIYEIIFNTCRHSGLVGHTLGMFRQQLDILLRQNVSSHLFMGENLVKIFKLVSEIPDGATTDLLENSDRILSVLNFVRYLVIRDPPGVNITGIWNFYPKIETSFFQPLRHAIELSKGHYNLDLEDTKKGIPLSTDTPEFSVNVSGETFGKVSKEQKIQVIESGINTFDMMDSILSRVIELAEGQKRLAKENQMDILGRQCQATRFLCVEAGGDKNGATSQSTNTSTAKNNGQRTMHTQEEIKSYSRPFEEEDPEEAEETEEEYQTKQKILKASLPYVHQHGWTQKALIAGAEELGMPSVAHGMFPRGGVELVFYFYEECNKELSKILETKVQSMKEQEQKLNTKAFIQEALEERLKMIVPYLDKWSQAMAIQTLPQNAVESWTNLGHLMDEIWYYAGDKSTDFNWYTKRGSLAVVYKSTEIFMIQDKSEDLQDTWQFLDRRLKDTINLGKLAHNIEQSGTVLYEGAYGMCTMTRNILGMNSKFR